VGEWKKGGEKEMSRWGEWIVRGGEKNVGVRRGGREGEGKGGGRGRRGGENAV